MSGEPSQRAAHGVQAYSAQEVAGALGLSVAQVRGFVRRGLIEPARGPRGALRFSFQDLVFLRRIRALTSARIPPRRVHRALEQLRERLGEEAARAGLRLTVADRQVVVRDAVSLWRPDSGQCVFDFEAGPQRHGVAMLPGPEAGRATPGRGTSPAFGPDAEVVMTADDWYLLGCELEADESERARDAYLRALALEPGHAEAHLNLGCLYHQAGKLQDAEAHYRAALDAAPRDAVAAFDLGVVLEDQQRLDEARAAYLQALELDARCADAHYNLARLYEARGEPGEVLRHLLAYRRLTRGEAP